MNDNFRKRWFERRIFVSLSIVLSVTLISFLIFKDSLTTVEWLGNEFGLSRSIAVKYGFILIALFVLIATLLRMWAGSILSSTTVMSFKIQNEQFHATGPYALVRNPIYTADLIAFTSLSLCLTPVGLLIPMLIYLHYLQLIAYEQAHLRKEFGSTYETYLKSTPPFFPSLRNINKWLKSKPEFFLNFDGFRHNAPFLLFVPGLIVAAFTGNFLHAILIGLPGIIDWAVVHIIIGIQKKTTPHQRLTHSKVFKDILYSQCWEDVEMDLEAFRIKPGDSIFTITSGGCNALAFLLGDPKEIVCLDLNKYQNYLLTLKIQAFKNLSYPELLEFMGVKPSKNRTTLYQKLAPSLSQDVREYWDSKQADINRGILHSGRYERYMKLLKNLFQLLVGRKVIQKLYRLNSPQERLQLYEKQWDNLRWRLFCRLFLSRTFASLLFDKAFYRWLEPNFSFERYYRGVVKKAVTELPLKENSFLAYMLLGNYYPDHYPVYLRPEHFEIIRQRVDRIQTITSGCMDYFRSVPSNTFSQFNFTNIFEWMSEDEYADVLRETWRIAKPGAVLTYRNHLVTRWRPENLSKQIEPDKALSNKLHDKDVSFIYKGYVVERIIK